MWPLALEEKGIVELTVDGGIEIVNKDIAVEDFIYHKRHSIISGSILYLIVIGLFLLALECRK